MEVWPVRLLTSRSERSALLAKIPLFDGLSKRQLEDVAKAADEVTALAGTRLATRGETGNEMYVIVAGEAVVQTGDGRNVRLGPGDFFGEMSLVDGGPRSATVDAATDLQLLALGRREFWGLLDQAPTLVRKIMAVLSRRLRTSERSPSA
jgi:CRP-like cAMP-binding protein